MPRYRENSGYAVTAQRAVEKSQKTHKRRTKQDKAIRRDLQVAAFLSQVLKRKVEPDGTKVLSLPVKVVRQERNTAIWNAADIDCDDWIQFQTPQRPRQGRLVLYVEAYIGPRASGIAACYRSSSPIAKAGWEDSQWPISGPPRPLETELEAIVLALKSVARWIINQFNSGGLDPPPRQCSDGAIESIEDRDSAVKPCRAVTILTSNNTIFEMMRVRKINIRARPLLCYTAAIIDVIRFSEALANAGYTVDVRFVPKVERIEGVRHARECAKFEACSS